jgi:hypothetical protein
MASSAAMRSSASRAIGAGEASAIRGDRDLVALQLGAP